ncbi:hypothetical protein I4U23_018232 [Adineta vaga]|nr:hypothetical protein I4U23_018232 [Adineta vaga]
MSQDQKIDMNKLNEEVHYPSTSPIEEVNRARKILLLAIIVQLILTIVCTILGVYAYIFNYNVELQPYSPIILFLLFFTCLIFIIGLVATDRYLVNSLLIFTKLMMIDLILIYLSLAYCFIIPMGRENYETNGILKTIVFALSYLMIFCGASILPAYTIRYSLRLANLLTDSEYVARK